MKKILLSACVIALGMSAGAQQLKNVALVSANEAPYLRELSVVNTKSEMQARSSAAATVVFEEDFDGGAPENWEIITTGGPVEWKWTDVGHTGDFPTEALASTSAANGWMIVDSDADNFEGGDNENSQLILNEDIDCSEIANVVVSFEQMFRRWQADTCIIKVSNDGGATWAGKYYVNPSITQDGTDNPDLKMVNISDVAGNYANVRIMFEWYGAWDYGWQIDDVKVMQQPANDLELYAAALSMMNTDESLRDFYGRVPSNQVSDVEYTVGVYNFGVNQQTNVTTSVDVNAGAFYDSFVYGDTLHSDSSYVASHENFFALSGVGEYENVYSLSSDSTDLNEADNTATVLFSVTDTVMSPDFAYDAVGTVGTFYYSDGFKAANMIELIEADELTSATIFLGSSTIPGGSIQLTVADTTGFLDNVSATLFSSEFYTITDADTTNGYVLLPIPTMYNGVAQDRNLAVGAYYVSVECYSNQDNNPISILDDRTYEYRNWYGSVIFADNADGTTQWFSNGESIAIRANFGTWAFSGTTSSVEEPAISTTFNAYPNPTSGLTRFAYNLSNAGDMTISVRNMMGQVVYTSYEGFKTTGAHETAIDLSKLAKGAYTYELNIDNSSVFGKLIVK